MLEAILKREINSKSADFALITVSVVFCFLRFLFGFNLWWMALPITIYVMCLVYGSACIRSEFYTKVHCSADTSLKEIAITFDDGPHKIFTPKILAVLAEFQAPATFFMVGKNVLGNENLLKSIDAEGHAIGNHTYSHSHFIDFKGVKEFTNELDKTSNAIYNVIGRRPKLFRPPYGVTTPYLAKACEASEYTLIGWSIRSFDTTHASEDLIASRVQKQIKPGAIILFHDTSNKTVNVLRRTLNYIRENGFKTVRVDQLLKIRGYK